MRTKKTIKNAYWGMIGYIISFFPRFLVRKVFLDTLGAEMLGLTSLYSNILGYLSIVEMGIGSAIIYSMYKPYHEDNKTKIKGYLNYYKKFYKIAGIIILCIGLSITPFIHFFVNESIDLGILRYGFILFLINSFISYLFTYKYCMLYVAQEGYKVYMTINFSKVIIAVAQVISLIIFSNFYIYLLVQIIITFITYLCLNNYINKRFSWLKSIDAILEKDEEKDLKKNIKSLFFHKIGNVFVGATDNIVISSFINLKTVAIYNNYYLLTSIFIGVLGSIMNNITAGIGSLLVEKDNEYSYRIHSKVFFVNFWIVSFIVISLVNTIDQFIILWVGKEYLIDKFTLVLILLNLYMVLIRNSVEQFKNASGEYYRDRYAPVIEGIMNLVISVILVNLIGLSGVFIGTLLSNLLIVFWVKPYIVYKYVFNKSLIEYFKLYFKYLFIGLIPLIITMVLTDRIKSIGTPSMFILNCIINIVVINLFYLIIFWQSEEFKYFKNIVEKMIKKLKKKIKQ